MLRFPHGVGGSTQLPQAPAGKGWGRVSLGLPAPFPCSSQCHCVLLKGDGIVPRGTFMTPT